MNNSNEDYVKSVHPDAVVVQLSPEARKKLGKKYVLWKTTSFQIANPTNRLLSLGQSSDECWENARLKIDLEKN